MSPFKQRMYFLVMYNISPIQQGIQAGHCAEVYAYENGNTSEYKRYIEMDKTWMIMNGGTSNSRGVNFYNDELAVGTMETHADNLDLYNVKHSKFFEPDLNNSLSAICFLVDERIWDKNEYIVDHTIQINNSNAPGPEYCYTGEIPYNDVVTDYYANKYFDGDKSLGYLMLLISKIRFV